MANESANRAAHRLAKFFQAAITPLLVICAIVTTGLASWKAWQFAEDRPRDEAAVFHPEWQSYLREGDLLGSGTAKVKIIEFGDFECPFCASFHEQLKGINRKYPDEVAVYYIHLPLQMHRFALPAARAAECAAREGRFAQMHDALFRGQAQFGIKPWTQFAKEAGLSDLSAFTHCQEGAQSESAVTQDALLAKKLGIAGTPTIIVNGWKIPPRKMVNLTEIVERASKGQKPI